MTLTFGSLFSGIGGLDLGLERAGLKCSWQVEVDDYARKVLQKHWLDVPKWRDVRYFLSGKRWRRAREAWQVDLVCGGFPCQDISNAGRRAGINGKRSGLWREFARIVRLLRPRYVLVENVPALTVRGLDRVLGDLAALGYDAEWDCIPAAAVGAPHLRWRIFILAYSVEFRKYAAGNLASGNPTTLSHTDRSEQGRRHKPERQSQRRDAESSRDGEEGIAADAQGVQRQEVVGGESDGVLQSSPVSDSVCKWSGQRWREQFAAYCERTRDVYWKDAVSPVCGVADGVPHRVDRLRGLGNAVVPQIAEYIGRQILNHWQEEAW